MDALRDDIDNFTLCVFAVKEEDYVIILMSAYGKNDRVGK